MAEPASAPLPESAWSGYLRGCAARDESALAALYDESSQLTYSIALRILQDEADACEVMLDVYKQVWEKAARFDERRGSAAAWIVLLARSRAIDRRRFRAARAPVGGPAGRPAGRIGELRDVPSTQPSPETLAIHGQNRRAVLFAMQEIPAEQRQALELSFFAGLSHSEVAQRLGEPLGTVKTRIRLAIGRLRDLLRDQSSSSRGPQYDGGR